MGQYYGPARINIYKVITAVIQYKIAIIAVISLTIRFCLWRNNTVDRNKQRHGLVACSLFLLAVGTIN